METSAAFTELANIVDNLGHEFDTAWTITDPELTGQALENRRKEERDSARGTAVREANGIIARLALATEEATARAEAHRPHLDVNNSAELQRTTETWVHNIRTRLDAGKGWPSIIGAATRDDALAIERFGEAWVTARAKSPTDASLEWGTITTALRARHADLATTEEGREAINQADNAAADETTARHIAAALVHARNRSQLGSASIALKLIATPIN
ncbi:hypothetical protein ACNPM4_06535 [Microbacterium sp. AGC62]